MDLKTKPNRAPIYLIILCFSIYFIAYLGRYSYSSNINCIMEDFNINRASAGSVGTFFFISYGIGQVVHGLLCKKYNPKYALSLALIVSSIMNLLVGITNSTSFESLKIYWLINGFFQSILWSSLIRLLSEYLPKDKLNTAIFVMAFPVSLGTFAIYGLSSLISMFNITYKLVFFIASILLFLIGFICFFNIDKIKNKCLLEKEEVVVENIKNTQQKAKLSLNFIIVFAMLAVFAIANNFVKDGLTTWMPTILKEKYALDNSLSTFLTIFLPLFAAFGGIFAIFLNKKLSDFIYVCGILYLIAFIMFAFVLLTLSSNIWILPLICFMIVACAMSGVNSILTGIYPMLYAKENSGTVAGVLDGFCYVGSAITAFGMGSVADKYSWNTVFYILLAACGLMIVICLVYIIASYFNKKAENKPL